jgi:hypothetical protein
MDTVENRADGSALFILEAFDCDLWCPVAQAAIPISDANGLRAILGDVADSDPKLEYIYFLDDEQLTAFVATFNTYDPRQIGVADPEVRVYRRWPDVGNAPYLVHTGYELPLLLEGRKKLARMSSDCPGTFDGEERFDRWVANGVLHKEEVIERFEKPVGERLGWRTVYYTAKGEEWRIPAAKLLDAAAGKSGGWNEYFFRLEGMLFGYEDWQNDWWIQHLSERGALSGATYWCGVTAAGLAWTESAGLRALPPAESCLVLRAFHATSKTDLQRFMREHPEAAALLRFTVDGYAVSHVIDRRHAGPWKVESPRIPELNKILTKPVVVLARRGEDVDA